MGYPAKKEIQLENGTVVKVGNNSFPISAEKFKTICREKNILYSDISRAIGYASNSISSALNAGYMNGVMIKGIENMFGIKYEEYAYIPPVEEKPEEKPVEQPEEKPVKMDMTRDNPLYDTIKNAVIDGIMEALAGNMKNLRGMVYTAVYAAINEAKAETKKA